MKPKKIIKITVDLGMTVLLLLLMAYELVGQAAHEWLGIGMFVLFVLHHILNRAWIRNIRKGSYRALRIWQTVLVVCIFLSMFGSMVSGVILSRHVLAFLPIHGGRSLARSLHMVCSYGGFVLMSLHLGFHWTMFMGLAGKRFKQSLRIGRWIFQGIGVVIACYGMYAFVKRDIGSYLFLRNQFVFFDFDEPLVLFFLDYMAVMGFFVFVSHYFAIGLKKMRRKNKDGK